MQSGARSLPKVAIPRMEPRLADRKGSGASDKHRVERACTQCRKRKTKCSAELPRCRACVEAGVECIYVRARKDRLRDKTEQNVQLITLLRDISPRANSEDRRKIDELLDSIGLDDDYEQSVLGKHSRDSPADHDSVRGELHAPGSAGSNEDLDLMDEDLFRSHASRAIGFVGQNSEVQWLRSLKHQMGHGSGKSTSVKSPFTSPAFTTKPRSQTSDLSSSQRESPAADEGQYVADSTFYLDRDDLDVDMDVDEYELPPIETAERLFACYMTTMHTSFPILPQDFEEQFREYVTSVKQQDPIPLPREWRATLNLVFAIGTVYSHRAQAKWPPDDRVHLTYMARAVRLLRLKDTLFVISTPDLAIIQTTALLSLYYLVIGHISRSWIAIGLSLRAALAVGLHLKVKYQSISHDRNEALVRTWWALHSIECLVSAATGRPCVIAEEDCTVSLPRPRREEQPGSSLPFRHDAAVRGRLDSIAPSGSSSSMTPLMKGALESLENGMYFEARIRMSLITHRALSLLYSARAALGSWERIQEAIAALSSQMDKWRSAVFPNGLPQTDVALTPPSKLRREQLLLLFAFHSTKLLITRPCLCRLDLRIKGQSDRSAVFNQNTAVACVQAAQDLTQLLSDDADLEWLYENGPWWCIVHNMMQAMAVFLLEIFYGSTHITPTNNHIPQHIIKLILWLRSMRDSDPVAGRAYKIVFDIVKNGGSRIPNDIMEVLVEDETESFPHREQTPQAFEAQPNQSDLGGQFNSDYRHAPEYPNSADPVVVSQAIVTGQPHPFLFDGFYPNSYYFSGNLVQRPAAYADVFMGSSDQPDPPPEENAADYLWNWLAHPRESQDDAWGL